MWLGETFQGQGDLGDQSSIDVRKVKRSSQQSFSSTLTMPGAQFEIERLL